MVDLLHRMAAARLSTSPRATPFACGIVNVKGGGCSEDCAFCAQSARHAAPATTPPGGGDPDDDELLRRAESMHAAGLAYMGLVATGRGPTTRELDRYCAVAERLASRVDIRLCASLGVLTAGEAARTWAAGSVAADGVEA